MSYYILYPKSKKGKVKIVTKRPGRAYHSNYGFAEGSFKNLTEVKKRLNWMNVPVERRPKNCR